MTYWKWIWDWLKTQYQFDVTQDNVKLIRILLTVVLFFAFIDNLFSIERSSLTIVFICNYLFTFILRHTDFFFPFGPFYALVTSKVFSDKIYIFVNQLFYWQYWFQLSFLTGDWFPTCLSLLITLDFSNVQYCDKSESFTYIYIKKSTNIGFENECKKHVYYYFCRCYGAGTDSVCEYVGVHNFPPNLKTYFVL